MPGFITTPYLPKKKTSLALGDIEREDINIISPCDFLNLPESLKKHGDLSFCYLGEGEAVCARGSYEYYKEQFKNLPLKLTQGERAPDRHYPLDAAYNVAIVGKKMFCRKDICDKILLNKAEEMGYKIININQGYGKCSVCPIDEKSAISGDVSFARAAEKEGIDTLLVTNEGILLPPYSCGFFGGGAYMESEKVLSVNGDLKFHSDEDKIRAFLEKREITIKEKKGMPIFDFGSFIPILEE